MIQKTYSKLLKSHHPSWNFYGMVTGVIAGTIVSNILQLIICQELIWIFIAGGLLIFSLRISNRLTFLFAVLSGLIFANFRVVPEIIDQQLWKQLAGQILVVSGKIGEDPESSSKGATLRLKNLCFWPPGTSPTELTNHQNISSSESGTTVDHSVKYDFDNSDKICLSGTLYVQFSNQPDVARSDYVILNGKLGDGFGTFAASLYRPQLLGIEKIELGDPFYQFKVVFANLVRQFIPTPESDLGLSYLMSMKSGLSEDFSEALQMVGMTHVVVASGAHLAILSGAVKKIFGRISKFAGTLFGLLIILAFALVVGFTPSMTRAVLVASLSLLVAYCGRSFTPLRLLSLVAAITLLITPSNFMNLGWQLSFASFFGILILAPALQKSLYGGKKPPWLASMLITSLATSLVCAPILIFSFGTLSLLSFVANLVILPTLPYAMLLVLLSGATSFLPFLAGFIARLATLLLDLHIWVINYLSEKTIFVIDFPEVGLQIFLLYFPILLFLLSPHFCKMLRAHLSVQKKHQQQ